MPELVGSAAALERRYRRVQAELAERSGAPVPFRVAVSAGHLDLTARLVSVAFGSRLLGHPVDLDRAWCRLGQPGVLPLATVDETATGEPTASGESIADGLPNAVRLAVRHTAVLSISERILWGNVVSAVNGAAVVVGLLRPELAAPARTLARQWSADPALTGSFTGSAGFRRTNCCLYYRVGPTPTYCLDCVLVGPLSSKVTAP